MRLITFWSDIADFGNCLATLAGFEFVLDEAVPLASTKVSAFSSIIAVIRA